MGIYSYELFEFYDVETIIRIGSCGSYKEDLNLLDIVLVDKAYSESNYSLTTNNEDLHIVEGSEFLNSKIEEKAKILNQKYKKGTIFSSESFYMNDLDKFYERVPKGIDLIAVEMEAFSLFYNAKILNKNAACLVSVTDEIYSEKKLTSEERRKSLRKMIELALDSLQ